MMSTDECWDVVFGRVRRCGGIPRRRDAFGLFGSEDVEGQLSVSWNNHRHIDVSRKLHHARNRHDVKIMRCLVVTSKGEPVW